MHLASALSIGFPWTADAIERSSYYIEPFLDSAVLLLICDGLRQLLYRRFFFVRTTLEVLLVVAAVINVRSPFYPSFGVVVVIVGCLAAYLSAAVADIRAAMSLIRQSACATMPPT